MEQEINSQAQIIENLINKYIVNYCVLLDVPLEVKRIAIVASGSSYNAGVFGKYFFENISKVSASVEYASEFISNSFEDYDKDTLYIFISQSGMSVDTVEALHRVKKSGVKTLAITNSLDSTIHVESDYKFFIDAGVENAIAATKTYSATVLMLWLIALKIAQNKHMDIAEETQNIHSIRTTIESAINNADNLELAAKLFSGLDNFVIFGLGYNYPICMEAALKIRETSYIATSAYPGGEFVHGHFAVLNETKAFLTFISNEASEYELKTLEKVKNTYKKAKSVVVSDCFDDYGCDILIKFPKAQSNIATIMAMIMIIQLLALKIASRLKRDVDNPQGLVKIVDKKG